MQRLDTIQDYDHSSALRPTAGPAWRAGDSLLVHPTKAQYST